MIRIYDVPPTAEPSSQIPAQTHDRPQVPRPAHRGPLAHELAFGALYALVLVRLVLAPAGPAWSEIGVWLGSPPRRQRLFGARGAGPRCSPGASGSAGISSS